MMEYEKLCADIETPEVKTLPLKAKKAIKFHYYLSSRVNGNLVDLDITSKLFDRDQMYIRKSCYRVGLGEIEKCVKKNTVEHMLSLGILLRDIPASLRTGSENNTSAKEIR